MTHQLLTQAKLFEEGKAFVSCVIVKTEGSTPRKAGARMTVASDGQVFGSIGGGAIEAHAIMDARSLMGEKKPILKSYKMEDDLETMNGGEVHVFLEPFGNLNHLIIFGAGHVGQAVAKLARDLDFRVYLLDERQGLLESVSLTGIEKVHGDFETMAHELHIDKHSYILITTHEHAKDERILGIIAQKEPCFIGMIASQKKAAKIRENLLAMNILTVAQLDKVNMPVGIKIASETPQEIAISILAKLIDLKNTTA